MYMLWIWGFCFVQTSSADCTSRSIASIRSSTAPSWSVLAGLLTKQERVKLRKEEKSKWDNYILDKY